jgi:hypothetical protein
VVVVVVVMMVLDGIEWSALRYGSFIPGKRTSGARWSRGWVELLEAV